MSNLVKNQYGSLLSKEINRAQFLKFMGVTFLGMFGVVQVFKNLHRNLGDSQTPKKGSGYGKSAYGR